MGGKASAPAPPDYRPIAAADAQAASQQFQLGQQQLDWAKNQFNTVWPYAQQYLDTQTATTNEERAAAQQAQQYYTSTYQPIESQFAQTALNYNNPARAQQNAGMAMADVSNAFEAQRNALTSSLESYGIDPSQTRYGALDLSSRISQAAATAAAGTQSRRNTEATGLALMGEAINTGRGYPSSVAQAYSTATGAGQAGLGAANQSFATGASAMGSPTSYFSGGNTALSNQAQALNYGANNAYNSAHLNASIAANQAQGIGSLIGGALGFGAAVL
jgi:hypothetical protein